MTKQASAPTKLDLWVVGTMRHNEGARRLRQAGMPPEDASRLAQQLNSTVLADPHVPSASVVTDIFGTPAVMTPDALLYELSLWPDHYYKWNVLRNGSMVTGGFVLKAPPSQLADEAGLSSVPGFLRHWHHTREDVTRLLGPPHSQTGWWPEDTLFYGPLADGQDLVLVFNHGLLAQVQRAHPEDSRSR